MSGQAGARVGVVRRPRFTFWLTFIQSYMLPFFFNWTAFIFSRDDEEDQ